MTEHLLEVRDLSVEFHTAAGTVKAVQNVSWHLDRGETLAILGESGSGKSVSASAIMNLIDMPPGRITSGQIRFGGQDLLTLSDEQRRAVNGRRIAMIFQDPLSHLNPVYTVGWQIAEAMTIHGTDQARAKAEALRLLTRVGIPDPAGALRKYPHEFSGGQRQRLMIAMALAMKPDVLIADEPTTALDVTVQRRGPVPAERTAGRNRHAILIITHDLGVVAEIADRVVVMNGGVVVETGSAAQFMPIPAIPIPAS
ncbi:ABC transporter ATP-binding protein [Paracoccus mutanolyticus]|uniref:ABC transporter ATP-binding protein n=1 Tax=Paracoccus mutanolyticus TaxID=1499308 RepID=UPI001CB95C0A|nr:ABC transporter ATP-binding protein [Paracoccus mutanolyticus]